jgi:hypothetical protein
MGEPLDVRLFRMAWLTKHWKWVSWWVAVKAVVRSWRAVGLVLVGGWVFLTTNGSLWLTLAAVIFLWAIFRKKTAKAKAASGQWYASNTLVPALVQAGVLKQTGENLPMVSYRGKAVQDAHGTTVTVELPQATTLADVTAKRSKLAAGLRIPVSALEIRQEDTDPASVVRITVRTGKPIAARAEVATQTRTRWDDPVRIAQNLRGQEVRLDNDEQNSLFAGMPGKGKTSLGRIRLAHYLLDPTTQIFLLDGKGAVKDYGSCRSMLSAYVNGTDETAVPEAIAMLTRVLDEVRRRNREGGRYPGWLILLEEYQDVRAAANPQQLDQLDTLLGRIIRMGRAVSIHVQILTQRPTVDDVPSSARNLITQRIALELRDSSDTALVLGSGRVTGLDLPKGRGNAILADSDRLETLVLDRLTDEDWEAICVRAEALRAEAILDDQPTAEIETVEDEAPEDDPVMRAVVHALYDGDPKGMNASAIHKELPGWATTAYPTAHQLSFLLRRHPETVKKVYVGNGRGWALVSRTGDDR